MRPDMHEVVSEPGRVKWWSHGKKYRTTKRISLHNWEDTVEDLPKQGRMLARSKNHRRGNYNPIDRFLQSRLGQNWGSIYSEIREVFKGFHWHELRRVLDCFVAVNVEIEKDDDYNTVEVYELRGRNAPITLGYDCFYVNEQGFLAKTPRKPIIVKQWKQRNPFEKNGITYQKYDGIWYQMKKGLNPYFENGVIQLYGFSKDRQLGKKELRRLRLSNDSCSCKDRHACFWVEGERICC